DTLTSINDLPHELLLAVFKLYVDMIPAEIPVTLTLVCKLWRYLVEDTANLWCHVSGGDGLEFVRKALAMVKDAPLEISYYDLEAKMSLVTFFTEIKDRFAQAKSIHFDTAHLPEILKTTPATRLETLDLAIRPRHGWDQNPATLFGGEPASPALKNLHLYLSPVNLEPLRLSGLHSLQLSHVPIGSAEELLRILMESPALEDCCLERLNFLTKFIPSETRQRLLDAQSSVKDANRRAIRLLHLRHLTLLLLPPPFTHLLLSTIQASVLQSFDLSCTLEERTGSEVLAPDTYHLVPAVQYSTTTAEKIEINYTHSLEGKLRVGRLAIEFEGVQVDPRHQEETLGWVFCHQAERLKALPTSLVTWEHDKRVDLMLWLSSSLRVTNLVLRPIASGGRSQPWSIISLLSRSVPSMSNQWALPDMESIDTNVLDEAGKREILEMVEARHSFIQAQEEQGRSDGALKQFKHIRLHGGRNKVSSEQAPNAKFLIALEKVGRGAELWWEGVKWAGSGV
ncbi:hypothetical protein FRC00_008455, partial [Tulasnella sp. 408]